MRKISKILKQLEDIGLEHMDSINVALLILDIQKEAYCEGSEKALGLFKEEDPLDWLSPEFKPGNVIYHTNRKDT